MSQLLLIDDDPGTLTTFEIILRAEGHKVLTASTGREGLQLVQQEAVDLVLADLRLPDITGLDILRCIREMRRTIRVVIMTGFSTTQDAITALRLGAADFLEKPIDDEDLRRVVAAALPSPWAEAKYKKPEGFSEDHEAHAAVRWASALLPVIHARADPRTLAGWSRLISASPGAIRNWCRTVGISPRRSLVFARLLRTIILDNRGERRLENLLDVADRRTIARLLRFAGFNLTDRLPESLEDFIARQKLVWDPDALRAIKRAMAQRQQDKGDHLQRTE